MNGKRKPVGWLRGEVKSPPFSSEARMEAGLLLGRVQCGETLKMPHSKPMPEIGPGCHELRIKDAGKEWRVVYAVRPNEILVLDVFRKTTKKTPANVIEQCRKRIRRHKAKSEGNA